MDARTSEIVRAVDALIEEHNRWENDVEAPEWVPAEFEAKILEASEAAKRGDVPQRCLNLVRAVDELQLEWDLYAAGNHQTGGAPLASLWKAYRAVLSARHVAIPVPARRVESVKTLISQGVPYNQIARFIYGHNGEGPFLTNGQVRTDLIEKEAATPGSILGSGWENWIHPTELQRVQLESAAKANDLLLVDDQISKASSVPAAITANPPADQKPETCIDKGEETEGEEEQPVQLTGKSLDALILEVYQGATDKSASDIVDLLKTEHGQVVTAPKVSDVIRQAKREKSGAK